MWRAEAVLGIKVTFCAIVACFAVFALWPSLDLIVSGWFYSEGAGFNIDKAHWSDVLRNSIWNLSTAMVLCSIAMLAVSSLTARRPLNAPARLWAYILALYAMSTGILVNGILKSTWGRARPADVIEFGGLARFTPPHQMTDQCFRNCSFVSGEMSAAVALCISLLFLLRGLEPQLPRAALRFGRGLAFALPVICGAQRIFTGRHFLSDVILAGLFTILIALALSPILPKGKGGPGR